MSYIEELKELAKLKDDGILTEEEFQKKKEEILSNNSESEPVSKKTEATPPEKKGLFERTMGKILDNRLDVVEEVMKDNPQLKKATRKYHNSVKNYRKSFKKAHPNIKIKVK